MLEGMDQHLLYYILVFIWLLPFTFGSDKIHDDVLNTCLDGRFHKSKPGIEDELFSQCSPWKSRSCCTNATAKSLHEPNHYNFNLDHCAHKKPMSEECKKHFIQDLCFYECSPNVGHWLVKVNMKSRKEKFFEVPLCKSECSAWFEACRYDFTCNVNWIRGFKWTSAGNVCHDNVSCETFETIFHNSTNFCEKVWDHSWKVVEDDVPCMKIWFNSTDGTNPNDAVARHYVDISSKTSSAAVVFSNILVNCLSLFVVLKFL